MGGTNERASREHNRRPVLSGEAVRARVSSLLRGRRKEQGEREKENMREGCVHEEKFHFSSVSSFHRMCMWGKFLRVCGDWGCFSFLLTPNFHHWFTRREHNLIECRHMCV